MDNLRVDWWFSPCSRRRWPKATALLTATVWNEKAKSCMSGPPRRHRHRRGRVGTTTVAGNLCHLRTGEILASASRMNPQVPFGEDLMSRVSYAMMSADGTERMQAIIAGLNELVDEMCAQAGIAPADVIEMVLVGNTTMRHLLLGVNRELGGAPFNLVVHSAVDVKARSGPGHRTGRQHPHPALRSGSRGCGQRGRAGGRGPYAKDEQALIIDIGTNEILLGNREQVLRASSPTTARPSRRRRSSTACRGQGHRACAHRPGHARGALKLIGADTHGCPHSRSRRLPDAKAHRRSRVGPSGTALLNPTLRPSGICSGILQGRCGTVPGRCARAQRPFCKSPSAPVDRLGDGGGKAGFVLAWPHETSTGDVIYVQRTTYARHSTGQGRALRRVEAAYEPS
ncbi:MAG: hypothetical protein R2838_16450 [Caldilineaceae bacterium]